MTAAELPGLAGLDGLRDLIAGFHPGPRAYIVEFTEPGETPLGNHGDTLMHRVFEAMLPELGLVLTDDPQHADVLLVRPSGALLDRYQAPRLLTERLAVMPDRPLIIFPSSSWFETSDPATMFAGRTSPTLWVCREQYSYDHLQRDWGRTLAAAGVELALDHDVVVSGRRHLPEVLGLDGSAPRNVGGPLVVARMGAEAGRMTDAPAASPGWRRQLVRAVLSAPAPLQRLVRRRYTRSRQLQANAAMLGRVRAAGQLVEASGRRHIDLSDPTLASFDRYAREVGSASLVVTDRLHIALPAAMLGTPTWLVESGYHKLAGVYERSLTGMDHVTFVRRP